MLRLGNNSEPSALYHGSDPVSRVYLGSTQVWPSTGSSTTELTTGTLVGDNLPVTSTRAGTLYYGWYPDGFAANTIDIPDMIAGTDTGQIANGTAGFFVAAGVLNDVEIPFDGLSGSTTYTLVLVVDIDDGGSYTNIVTEDITTPVDSIPPVVSSATTDSAGDTIILTMSKAVIGTESTSDWSVNNVTGGATVSSVTISSNTITLELSGNLVQNGDTPTVNYTAGNIEDAGGNSLANFTNQAIINIVPVPNVAVTYMGEYTNTSDVGGTTFTFSGVDIGTPAADREIYVVAQARARRADSITIAGVSDASPVRTTNSAVATSIGRALVASGTTATIVVEFEFSVTTTEGARIAIFEVTGKTSEITSQSVNNVTPPNTLNWNVQAGDAILGGAGDEGGGVVTVANLTQRGSIYDYDSGDEGGFWSDDNLTANASFATEISGGVRNSICFIQLR